jgi:hypothetical protein
MILLLEQKKNMVDWSSLNFSSDNYTSELPIPLGLDFFKLSIYDKF